MEKFVYALGKYHGKNFYSLYDAIGSLARSFGSHLNKPEYINLLIPPLITKFNVLEDEDEELVGLMECLSSVAQALPLSLLPYLDPLFQRCTTIVANTLSQQDVYEFASSPFNKLIISFIVTLWYSIF